MGGCCPENDPDEQAKKFGLVGALCLVVLVLGLVATWLTTSVSALNRQAARQERLNATDHDHFPVRRGDLDRG